MDSQKKELLYMETERDVFYVREILFHQQNQKAPGLLHLAMYGTIIITLFSIVG
jgi:hypothetical protein